MEIATGQDRSPASEEAANEWAHERLLEEETLTPKDAYRYFLQGMATRVGLGLTNALAGD